MQRPLAALAVTVAVCWPGHSAAGPKEQKLATGYTMLTDGDGNYLLVDERVPDGALRDKVYRAKSSSLYLLVGKRMLRWEGDWSMGDPSKPVLGYDDPRASNGAALLARAKTGWSLDCGSRRSIPLKPVVPAVARRELSRANLSKKRYRWRPRILARDREAYYYLIEELEGSNGLTYRAHIGTRAQMKLQKTVRLAADPMGVIIVTKRGTLRFSRDNGRIYLTDSKGTDKTLDRMNMINPLVRQFAFDDLGVYHGKRFESPCEVLAPRLAPD